MSVSRQMHTDPFTPEVVVAITRHMNDDHPDDTLVIVRGLGGQPAATVATMTGVDADGADFTAVVGDAEVSVRLAWPTRLTERRQVRHEVVRMYHQACESLGLDPRGGA